MSKKKPLYSAIVDDLQKRIAEGEYQPGENLPTESELCEQYNVSRITVRKALQILSEAGVIETRKGKGSFVAVDASELAPASMDLKKYCESFIQATRARLLLEPAIAENVVIVWLGGHAHHLPRTDEFNMAQDIAAARVVFDSPAPLVQLPCFGVVEPFLTTRYELEHWLGGKGALADYLCRLTVDGYRNEAVERPWSRTLWDVTAVAWLMNDGDRFMTGDIRPTPVPEYDSRYTFDPARKPMRYITAIRRDALFDDMFPRLAE